mmetsp:Transcript_55380/g.132284  ORF Transcript_55380/g.132284 Transcript_55380/m.132284 type:complete len:241 (-) Transcript_55380:10-732(-)
MEVVAEDVTLWKAASASPLSTLRREGLTPPSTPPHSWWQTSRPPSAASVEWFDGEAARPPSRNVVRYPAQRVYGSEGGLCGSLLGGPRDPCASTVVGATKERNLWAEPKRAAKAMLGTKRFAGTRATTLPADFVKWETIPAGLSTMNMDQPSASRHLAYSRWMGHPLEWRGTRTDGMELQGGSFGKMLRCNLMSSKENKLRSAAFNSEFQGDLRTLRRVARSLPGPTLKMPEPPEPEQDD